MEPPDSKPTGIPTTVVHDGMKVTTFRKDYENIRVTIEANNVMIYAKEISKEETQIIDQNSKDSAHNQLITFLSQIDYVAKMAWNHYPIDDTVIGKLANINIRESISFTDTNVSASKSTFNHFLAHNSKKVKVTNVHLAPDLHTDDILCQFAEPVNLRRTWNDTLPPTMITDVFLNQYNVSNLAKDDRTMIMSGLLNTKLTMKGIEDFAKKIYENKEDHLNIDYGIIGYDQLERVMEYKDKQADISWADALVDWNGQKYYNADLLRTNAAIDGAGNPTQMHRVSISLERSSTGIIEDDAKLPYICQAADDTNLATFNTISKAVSMKSDYSSIVSQQYSFDSIRSLFTMKNDMSPDKFTELLNSENSLLFDHFDVGQNLNRNLCTDEILMKVMCHQMKHIHFENCDDSAVRETVKKPSSPHPNCYHCPSYCIPQCIKVTDCDYVEVDLTDALLNKMADLPRLPMKIDFGKAITKFSSKGLEELLKVLQSSEYAEFDYNFGVIGTKHLMDIEKMFYEYSVEGYKRGSAWEYSFADPCIGHDIAVRVRFSHDRGLVMYQSFNIKAEEYFLQKFKTDRVDFEMIKYYSNFCAKWKLNKLKAAVESRLIKDFHATHNMQFIQFAFTRLDNGKTYEYGYDAYKDTLLTFFSSTNLDDPIMIAGREYVLSLPLEDGKKKPSNEYKCILM